MTEIARRSNVNDEYCTQALQAALELSMLNISGSGPRPAAMEVLDLQECQESKSQNVTECVAVPSSEHVAEIVGRQGCKIKALRAKTNTYIKTPVRGEEPVFAISGRPEHVSSARREILQLVEHLSELRASRRSAEDKVTTIHVKVPYQVVGLVVGPKGATVKRIQQVTQTYIVTPSRDKEPYFEVKGSPANVEKAKKEIERYISQRTKIDTFDLPEEHFNVSSCLHSTISDGLSTPLQRTFHQESSITDVQGSIPSSAFQYQGLDDFTPQSNVKFENYSKLPSNVSKLSSVFQYPAEGATTEESSLFVKEEATNVGGSSSVNGDVLKLTGKSAYNAPLVFSGMKFVPPGSSYQQLSAPLLAPDLAYSQSSFKGIGPQPISPTGSFESSCSDGITSMSPNLSPHSHLFAPTTAVTPRCYICNADEDRAVLIPCRHSNFCHSCAHYVTFTLGSCPICHTQVTNVIHL